MRLLDRLAAMARLKWPRRVVGVGLFLVSAGVVVWLVVQNAGLLAATPWRWAPTSLAIGVLLQASTLAIGSYVWLDISRALGAPPDTRRDLRVYAYSLLAKRLPGSLWHVAGRAVYYRDVGFGRQVGIAGSLVEMGLLVLTGAALTAVTLREVRPWGVAIGIGVLLVGPYGLGRIALRLASTDGAPGLSPGRIYWWAGLDAIAWLIGCAGVYFQFDAVFPMDPAVWERLVAATTASIVGSALVLVLPGGLGLRELGMAALLSGDMPVGVVAALAVALRIATAAIDVLWALAVIALVRSPRVEAVHAG
jgi:uncharacterized membrane protein YbhN (UPF0104 family)